jgi:hypothetical protein
VRECPPDRRTCAQVDCRHYLPRLPRARAGLAQLHPCSLVVAADGGLSCAEVGELLGGATAHEVFTLELAAVRRLRKLRAAGYDFEQPGEYEQPCI